MILFLRPQKWSQAQQHSALPLLKLAAGAHRPPSLVSKKDPTILVIRYHLGLHTHLFLSTVPYAVDRTVKEVQVLGKSYIKSSSYCTASWTSASLAVLASFFYFLLCASCEHLHGLSETLAACTNVNVWRLVKTQTSGRNIWRRLLYGSYVGLRTSRQMSASVLFVFWCVSLERREPKFNLW